MSGLRPRSLRAGLSFGGWLLFAACGQTSGAGEADRANEDAFRGTLPGVHADATSGGGAGGAAAGPSDAERRPSNEAGPTADARVFGDGAPPPADGGPADAAGSPGDAAARATDAASSSTDAGAPATDAPSVPPPVRPPGPCATPEAAAGWRSDFVRCNAAGALEYPPDDDGHRICDFSHAGYRGGGVPLPPVPDVETLDPVDGDATAAIQAALDRLAARPADAEGHRGAVLLRPGRYTIAGTLVVGASGVVLRGSGQGGDIAENTVLVATGNRPAARAVVRLGSGVHDTWRREVEGTRTAITTPRVAVCGRSFDVAEPGPFSVGDPVVVAHPSTEAWLDAVHHGDTHGEGAWTEGSKDLIFRRRIERIDGHTLTLDAPLFNTLDADLAQSTIYRLDDRAVTEVGLERLRIDIEAGPIPDEDHAATGVEFVGVRDAWADQVTVMHSATEGIVVRTGVHVTVTGSRALDPRGPIDGGYMYGFKTDGGQLVLFTSCETSGGRHSFVANGTTRDNGIVFHRSRARGSRAPSEGHHRWSMGLLYDVHREEERREDIDIVLGLYNRGDYGTGHGWATANSVAWNVDLAGGTGIIQQPPTAQNWAIGGAGNFTGASPPAPFDHPEGHIEGIGRPGLFPESLYEAQLAERLR